jgi:RNA polymerase sigma-54 factor
MALELKQQLKLTQTLVMTPQLQQAIKLLQLSRIELLDAVQAELLENPVLEEVSDEDAPAQGDGEQTASEFEPSDGHDGEISAAQQDQQDQQAAQTAPADGGEAPQAGEDVSGEAMVSDVEWDSYMESSPQTTTISRGDDDRSPIETNLTPRESLTDHLMWQLGFTDLGDDEKQFAARIIYNLSENGFLEEDIEEIAERADFDSKRAQEVLLRVQEFDPVGVATRDLSECLLVQARRVNIDEPLVLKIISDHLDMLQRKDFGGIARLEGVTVEQVALAAEVISAFEPHPGREFTEEDPIYITPDIYVHKVGDEYHVVLNEDGLPRLRVSQTYRGVLNRKETESRETRDYVRDKLRSAVWMIKSIHQRQRTIVRVMESIVRYQRDFFDMGPEHLRPLNLRDVAEDISMHESTVSRVTTNKYVQTPHGVYELKFFFNSSIQTTDGDAIASESVKEKIPAIIAAEDAMRPLSDQRISEVLRESKIEIARRTVTKYRESMRILSSTRRRQFR